jgi:phosphoribosylglycinamide formyltransferase-1
MTPAWAIFISGRGSNAQAVFEVIDEVPVRLVVSSKEPVWGLARARRTGVPTLVLKKKIDWEDLQGQLEAARVDRVLLLGFMKIVPASFLEKWQGRIFNVHPSLLPAFPGLQAIQRSYEANGPMGVSVHEVIPEMDAGKVIFQKVSVPASEGIKLEFAELLISRDEQRLVRTLAIERSNRWLEL